MKHITSVIILSLLLPACTYKAKVTLLDNKPVTKKYCYYFKDKGIDTFRNSNSDLVYKLVDQKNKTRFVYESKTDIENRNEGFIAQLYFQADSGVTSFTYTDDELQQKFTYYLNYNKKEMGAHIMSVNKGSISGVKNGNYWYVKINILLPETDTIAKINTIADTVVCSEYQGR